MVEGISVVIPNYNGIHLFPDTLPTVVAAVQALDIPSEIIVVDDCSTDASVAFLKENYPTIQVLVNEQNGGFSITSNNGIAAAQYSHVLLLNSDVKLTPTYFQDQFRYFEEPDTFGVMGRIVGWEDEIVQDGAKYPTFHGVKLKTSANYLLKDERQMDRGLYTMYLSGANALLDKEKFLQIGGFNEMFSPFYVEDVELSLRAWRLGYKCYYNYSSVCRHKTSTSIKSKSKKDFVNKIYNRNKMYLHALHLDGADLLLWYLQLLPETVLRAVGFKGYYLKALEIFFSSSSQIKQKREAFDALAKEAGKVYSLKEVAAMVQKSASGDKTIF